MARLISEIKKYESLLGDTERQLQQPELDALTSIARELHEKSIVLGYLDSLEAAVQRGEMNAVPEVKQVKEPELIRRSAEVKRPEPIKLEELPEVTGNINQEQVRMPGDEKLEAKKEEVKPAIQEIKEEPKPQVKEEKPVTEPVKPQKQGEIDLFGEIPVTPKSEVKPKEKEKQKPAAEDKSLARKLQKKPIADLKAAIGINEKFQFINELFEGNMTEYNIALNQLNLCSSHAEAEVYLSTLRELYKWDKDSETVVMFSELVERRFL